MKKENIILLLLSLMLLILAYQTMLLHRLTTKAPPEKQQSEMESSLPPVPEKEPNPYANADLNTDVFVNEDKTFGYQVFLNGSPMIRQPNIPGLPGNAGFREKQMAEKTAALVLFKIRKNIMPPAVSSRELDSLGVL